MLLVRLDTRRPARATKRKIGRRMGLRILPDFNEYIYNCKSSFLCSQEEGKVHFRNRNHRNCKKKMWSILFNQIFPRKHWAFAAWSTASWKPAMQTEIRFLWLLSCTHLTSEFNSVNWFIQSSWPWRYYSLRKLVYDRCDPTVTLKTDGDFPNAI